MHGGFVWPGIPNARGRGGVLGLEFRTREGVSSPDLLISEVQKTSSVCTRAKQTEPQRYDYEVGMRSLFKIAKKRLLSTVVQVVF